MAVQNSNITHTWIQCGTCGPMHGFMVNHDLWWQPSAEIHLKLCLLAGLKYTKHTGHKYTEHTGHKYTEHTQTYQPNNAKMSKKKEKKMSD